MRKSLRWLGIISVYATHQKKIWSFQLPKESGYKEAYTKKKCWEREQ